MIGDGGNTLSVFIIDGDSPSDDHPAQSSLLLETFQVRHWLEIHSLLLKQLFLNGAAFYSSSSRLPVRAEPCWATM